MVSNCDFLDLPLSCLKLPFHLCFFFIFTRYTSAGVLRDGAGREHLVVAGGRDVYRERGYGRTTTEEEDERLHLVTRSLNLSSPEEGWVARTDMPRGCALASSVVVENELWVIGGSIGWSGKKTSRVQAYNLVTNSWRELPPLPKGGGEGGAALVNGDVHVLLPGGRSVFRFNKHNNTWESLPCTYNVNRHYRTAAVGIGVAALGKLEPMQNMPPNSLGWW